MNYDLQLQWIRDLQHALRSEWMDSFFIGWNYADTHYFILAMIILCWYLWNRRIGIRLFYILILGFVLNQFLKHLFHQPRPCQIDPSVAILCFTSFGFPSGAAQTAAVVSGIIFLECKKWLPRVLGLVFALFLCFSRVYLGVHFFIDIVGGIASGCLLVYLYAKVFPLFEKQWKSLAIILSFLPLLLNPLVSLSWKWALYLCLSSLGIAIGLIVSDKKKAKTPPDFKMRGLQALSVIAGVILLYVIEYYIPKLSVFCSFFQGFWVSFLGGWLIGRRSGEPL
jgi:undecaprenyl-diphosphatase